METTDDELVDTPVDLVNDHVHEQISSEKTATSPNRLKFSRRNVKRIPRRFNAKATEYVVIAILTMVVASTMPTLGNRGEGLAGSPAG